MTNRSEEFLSRITCAGVLYIEYDPRRQSHFRQLIVTLTLILIRNQTYYWLFQAVHWNKAEQEKIVLKFRFSLTLRR